MVWDGKSEGTLNNISMMKQKNKRFFVVIEEMIVNENHIESVLKIKNLQHEDEKLQIALF